jgi:proline dehydrogenase
MKLNADRTKQAHAEELCTIRAELDEISMRETELRKTEYDFRREIVGGPKHPGGAVLAEAVERYFEDQHRQRDALIELLQRKDDRLRVRLCVCVCVCVVCVVFLE